MQTLRRNSDRSGSIDDGRQTRNAAGGRVGSLGAVVALLGLLLVITSLISFAGIAVFDSLQERSRASLRSILSGRALAMKTWLDERRSEAARQTANADIKSAAEGLLDEYSGRDNVPLAELKSRPEFQTLVQCLPEARPEGDLLGWALLEVGGRVIASGEDSLVNETLRLPKDSIEKVMSRDSTVTRPIRCPVSFAKAERSARPEGIVMCALSAVSSGGRAKGSVALLLDPLETFSQLLNDSETSGSQKTYALDRTGVLLSPSRFEEQLRAAGLLAPDPSTRSLLNVPVRDPGVDITRGDVTLPAGPRPLTYMADQATRGAKGENVAGYRDYLGVAVIGAWQWLPDYEFAIATEVNVSEAYLPWRRMRNGLGSLLGIVALGGLGWGWMRGRRGQSPSEQDRDGARRLGQYELVELVGRGGMGCVYRGHHDVLKRDVAVKVLEGHDVTPQSVTRFQREVRLTARLRHPNTIAIYDYGTTTEGTFFYVMEFVDGITIQQLVEDFGRQPPERVINLLLQVCGSLCEAHQQGLVHRDIKPANLLLTARAGLYDMIKVLDFGLVKEIERESAELTQSDAITGTPMYMSPESVRDARLANEQSDLYSIGAVGYTLLTGLPTFEGDTAVDICLKQLNEQPVRPSERIGELLPEDLQNVLMSCLRKDPEERPRSVEDLSDALQQCNDAHRWKTADAYRWWSEVYPSTASQTAPTLNHKGTSPGELDRSSSPMNTPNPNTAR